jgi:hypothetical protein
MTKILHASYYVQCNMLQSITILYAGFPHFQRPMDQNEERKTVKRFHQCVSDFLPFLKDVGDQEDTHNKKKGCF